MKPFAITSILAATDLSDSSVPALHYARLFADHFAAKLTVMYADPLIYPFDILGPAEGLAIDATPEHQAHRRFDVERHAAEAMAGRPYEIEVAVGQPIPAILAAAEREADLVVMGTHLRHGWRRALLGSVSEGVLHRSKCPVLTVARGDNYVGATPYAITHILCPVNFTEVARHSLHVAARLAVEFAARLTLVHVLEPDEVMNIRTGEDRVRRWVAPEMREVCSYRELVVRGGSSERVLDCADDLGADLLVVGAQHKLFHDATVVGTTTERLIHLASSPVLVVPREPAVREQTTTNGRRAMSGAR